MSDRGHIGSVFGSLDLEYGIMWFVDKHCIYETKVGLEGFRTSEKQLEL